MPARNQERTGFGFRVDLADQVLVAELDRIVGLQCQLELCKVFTGNPALRPAIEIDERAFFVREGVVQEGPDIGADTLCLVQLCRVVLDEAQHRALRPGLWAHGNR